MRQRKKVQEVLRRAGLSAGLWMSGSTMTTTTQKGKRLEEYVERFCKQYLAADFEVTPDVTVSNRQIDVLLQPRNSLLGPILVSCKNEKAKVDVSHLYDWAQIVLISGASSGIIVSVTGFTQPEVDFARNPERRLTLWHCRESTDADFGEVGGISVVGQMTSPCVRNPNIALKQVGAELRRTRRFQEELSAATRDRWTYHTPGGAVGNLWDDIQSSIASTPPSKELTHIVFEVEPRRLFTREGTQFEMESFSFDIQHHMINISFDVDFRRDLPFVFENVVSGERRLVPFPFRQV